MKRTLQLIVPALITAPVAAAGPSMMSFGAYATSTETTHDSAWAQQVESVRVETADGLTIRGALHRPSGSASPAPLVILVHQGMSDRSEWDAIVPRLRDTGFFVLAYDIRGHGASDPLAGPLDELWSAPDRAPLDLAAMLDFARTHAGVDPHRIFVMGGSIGANLAAAATARFGVAGAVSLSPNAPEVLGLSGEENPPLRDVLYVAGSEDRGGLNAGWAEALEAMTGSRTKSIVVEGSSAHGVALLLQHAELWTVVLEWLREVS